MKKLLFVSQVWPEPNSSAAGSRVLQLCDLFLGKNYEIIYASTASPSKFAVNLEDINIKKQSIKSNDSSFDDFIQYAKPEIVIFDRFTTEEQFGWRVAEFLPESLRVLDTEDLHFVRKARHQALLENRPFRKNDLFSEIAKREIASILRCDLSLIISEIEMQLLKNQFNVDENILFYLPFLLENIPENLSEKLPAFEERHNFTTIGNFRHAPNLDVVLYLKKSIWPLIRKKLPKAEIHVYGAYPSKKIMALDSPKTGFLVKGHAEDSHKMLSNAKILLSPLRFGAGLKGKFIEAMQVGTPSITTEIGAEGIAGSLPWPGKVLEKPEEIAEMAVDLYQNKTQWKKAQKAGFEIIATRFGKADFADKFMNRIEFLKENLKKHREENFFGALLMHHSLQSTKYMAKWIEEKNKS